MVLEIRVKVGVVNSIMEIEVMISDTDNCNVTAVVMWNVVKVVIIRLTVGRIGHEIKVI